MKIFRDRNTMYPNHLDEVDLLDAILLTLGFSPFVILPVYFLGVVLGWWR